MAIKPKRERRLLRAGAPWRVTPGSVVSLPGDFDPAQTAAVDGPKAAAKLLRAAVADLAEAQTKLAAQGNRSLLVIFQALDAGGKDGTIRHVFSGINPAGVRVHSFKEPSPEELAHDYLWRYREHAPAPGEIAVFNRSHYEEVLVVRVHPELLQARGLTADADFWTRRFGEINAWERELTERGVTIVKLMLNISREEQRLRFLRRCDEPEKHWKFSAADIRERAYWDDYQRAYSELLSQTSTDWAPWHVIPADAKWFARLASASVLTAAMREIDPAYPEVSPAALDALATARAELEAEAPPGAPADPFARQPDRETAPRA